MSSPLASRPPGSLARKRPIRRSSRVWRRGPLDSAPPRAGGSGRIQLRQLRARRRAGFADPARRYKLAWWFDGGMRLAVSNDGLTWTAWNPYPVIRHNHDITNVFYDTAQHATWRPCPCTRPARTTRVTAAVRCTARARICFNGRSPGMCCGRMTVSIQARRSSTRCADICSAVICSSAWSRCCTTTGRHPVRRTGLRCRLHDTGVEPRWKTLVARLGAVLRA